MNIQKKRKHIHILVRVIPIAFLVFMLGCTQDLSDAPIPTVIFPDIIIPLNLPENIGLKSKGATKVLNTGGVRGIIIWCQEVGVYQAYERNCSFHPNDACATVNIDNSALFMTDPCCSSTFTFETGTPTGGAAWRRLRKYNAVYDGSNLIITDEIVQEP